MISKDNNLIENLNEISEEINRYSNLSKEEIFNTCLERRLKAALERYNNEIEIKSDFLSNQKSFKILKAITKIQKNENKDLISKNLN